MFYSIRILHGEKISVKIVYSPTKAGESARAVVDRRYARCIRRCVIAQNEQKGNLDFIAKKAVDHHEKCAVTPESRYFPFLWVLVISLSICYFSRDPAVLSYLVDFSVISACEKFTRNENKR